MTRLGIVKVAHSFSASGGDAYGPYAGVINVRGSLYGTTVFSGAYGVKGYSVVQALNDVITSIIAAGIDQ